MKITHIDIGRDFTRTPGPRYRDDGPYSGQQFREEFLEPAFNNSDLVVVGLDSTVGFGASFLEESFGGLVRLHGLEEVRRKLRFEAVKRAFLLPDIESDMLKAEEERRRTVGAPPGA